MSIQIFTEQAALFTHPKDRYTTFQAPAFEFITAPDWITQSTMFKLLQKGGKIKVLGGKDKYIENNGQIAKVVEDEPALTVDEPGVEEVEEEVVNDNELQSLSEMSNKELYTLCKEKGLDVELKKNKEY